MYATEPLRISVSNNHKLTRILTASNARLALAWNRQCLGDTVKHTTTSACGRARRMDSALTSVQCKVALHNEHNESRAEPAACFPSKIGLVREINIASECIMLWT